MKRRPSLALPILAFLGLGLLAGAQAHWRTETSARVSGLAEALRTRGPGQALNAEALGRLAAPLDLDGVRVLRHGAIQAEWTGKRALSWLPRSQVTEELGLGQGGLLQVSRRHSWWAWALLWLAVTALMAKLGLSKGEERARVADARDKTVQRASEGRFEQAMDAGQLFDALSLLLRAVPPEGVPTALHETLGDIGQSADVDWVQLILRPEQGQGWETVQAWSGPGAATFEDGASGLEGLPLSSLSWLNAQLDLGEGLHLESPEQLPSEAAAERYLLQLRGFKAAFFAPLRLGNVLLGYLLLARSGRSGPIAEKDRRLAQNVAGVMAELIGRVRAQRRSERLAALESLHASVAKRFLEQDGPGMAGAFQEGLAELGRFTQAGHASLWVLLRDGTRIRQCQEWVARGASPTVQRDREIAVSAQQGLIRELKGGQAWQVPRVDRLGPGHDAERSEWSHRGVQAAVVQGLFAGGHLLGWLELCSDGSQALSPDADLAMAAVAPAVAAAICRERGDAALRASEERFKRMVEGLPDALIKADRKGIVIDARMPRGERIEAAQLLGARLAELHERLPGLAPGSGPALSLALEQAFKHGHVQVVDLEISGPQGQRALEARVVPQVHDAILLLRDRSEQRRQDQEQERQLGNLLAIFEAGTRGMILVSNGAKVQAFNQAVAKAASKDWEHSLKIGADLFSLLPEAMREPVRGLNALAQQGQEPVLERSFAMAHGAERLLRLQSLPVFSEDGSVRSLCLCLEPLDQLQEARDALRVSEERYALAARGSKDGLWDLDLAQDRLYVSARWERMLGLEAGEGPHSLADWVELMHPDDRETFRSRLQAHLDGRSEHLEAELRMVHAALTEHVWVLVRGMAVRDGAGKATRLAGSQSDVNLRKLTEDSLLKDALQDPLTGLPNRALVMDRLGRCHARSKRREGYAYALLYANTDDFKTVNQSLGSRAGDQLLKDLAGRLEGCLRPGDTVGRLGGDEFAVILDDLHEPGDATLVADRILEACRRPVEIGGRSLYPSVSIGIAFSSDLADSPSDILRDAETAMVNAKAGGRSRWMRFEPGMLKAAADRLDLEHGLREGLQSGQLHVHYQPLVHLHNGELAGFEALARWTHPKRGAISPAEFIPVAEASGLIVPLGRHILSEALCQWGEWAGQGAPAGLVLSVNLSPRQLEDPELLPELKQALRISGVAPANLQLELTESALMGNRQMAARTLEALRSLGVTIAIDDFGTGYSSLSYLHQFPAQTLKIDRSFVSRMDGLEENEAVTSAVVTLGRKLGMKLVAEGIETPGQAQRLRNMGCHLGQGYWFSRPVPPADVPPFWARPFDIPAN